MLPASFWGSCSRPYPPPLQRLPRGCVEQQFSGLQQVERPRRHFRMAQRTELLRMMWPRVCVWTSCWELPKEPCVQFSFCGHTPLSPCSRTWEPMGQDRPLLGPIGFLCPTEVGSGVREAEDAQPGLRGRVLVRPGHCLRLTQDSRVSSWW